MDTGIIQVFINAGALGAIVLAMLFGYLVPKPYVSKLEKENDLLREENRVVRDTNRELVNTVATNNQIIGELRSLARDRQKEA